MKDLHRIKVSPPQEGNLQPIGEALKNLDPAYNGRVRLELAPGTYREKLIIHRDSVELIGEDPQNTVIIYNDGALNKGPDGIPIGTFNTPTLFALGDRFRMENLSVINDAGEGELAGQAVALAVNGDGSLVRNCRIIACQDSLFCGPLPEKPVKGNLFGGPTDLLPRTRSRQLYLDCYIEGDVDFIFGSGIACFRDCQIHSRDREKEINGYVTAPSTAREEPYGFVFRNCRLTSTAGPDTVYLGRPWRTWGRTLFIECSMEAHIKKVGWDNWNKPEAEKLQGFQEWGCTGSGAVSEGRVDWSVNLPDAEKAPSLNEVLGEDFPWLSEISG